MICTFHLVKIKSITVTHASIVRFTKKMQSVFTRNTKTTFPVLAQVSQKQSYSMCQDL